MKLNYIYINGYKNLSDVEIEFEDGSSLNAIIGNNGSGKSNILEAITLAFASVYNDVSVEFSYTIRYLLNDSVYELSNQARHRLTKDGKAVKKTEYSQALPRSLFLYYCGETTRLQKMSIDYVDKAFNNALKKDGDVTLKYISAVGLKEFAAALLANAVYNTPMFERIQDIIGIENIQGPIVFKLIRPTWSKSAPITSDSFWNAQGTVATLLHAIKDVGELRIVDRDRAEIIVDNIRDVKIDSENTFDLFIRLELLIQAGILSDIEFQVLKNGLGFTHDMLSEGEKQLAQFLCILEATKEYRALFLMDEFDAFLHPKWQRNFATLISEVPIIGQVLFTTHSPLTLGKMQKENICIMKEDGIYYPAEDTYNRDISEILEEIMDVGKRPAEVARAIQDFKKTVARRDKQGAQRGIDELKELLSEGDPFWITIEHMMARLERLQ